MIKQETILTPKAPKSQRNQGESAFARISIAKNGKSKLNKIHEIISAQQHSLSYAPGAISANGRTYSLKYPLRCLLEREADFYVIKNEFLDLIGTGANVELAEINFNEEFDFLYQRLYALKKNQLSSRLADIKQMLNYYVNKVL